MTDSQDDQARDVAPHEVRQFIAEVDGLPFTSYRSIEDARRDPDSAAVLSGDYGGTIFLTVPVRLLGCSLAALETLVSDLDAVTWMSGDLTIATVSLERHAVGTGVAGGDGGGVVIDGVWTHPLRLRSEIREQAADVVLGHRRRIDLGLLRAERLRELDRKRVWRLGQPPLPRGLLWDFDISDPAVAFE